ncbi:MAG TPA: ABC transporter permease [Acidobacteriota bacterium]|nr:ABC transporter permease [Acidobacteriota bacterium]
MSSRAAKKVLEFIFTLFAASSAVFFLSRLAPSDPVEILLGENATFVDREALRKELKLDLPLTAQYASFLAGLLELDFGESLVTKRKVSTEILEALPHTLALGFSALLLSILAGLFSGAASAYFEGRPPDRVFGLASSVMMVSPSFLTGPVFLLFFAVSLPIFPVSGDGTALSFVLPALVLSIPASAYLGRVLRVSICEEKRKSYVLLAREKGAGNSRAFAAHMVPNSLIPFMQVAGLEFGALLTGAIITEKVFRIPGLGSLLARSVFSRDYTLITALIIVFSFIYLLGNLLADLLSPLVDPRLRDA